jgi:hypothetical protein
VLSKLSIDLYRTPIDRPPLAKPVYQVTPLLGSHGEQRAIASRADLDRIVRSEPETVTARSVMKPPIRELELFRRVPQRNHHGTDIEVLHDLTSDRRSSNSNEPQQPTVQQSLGSLFGGTLRLTAAYERVCIRAAGTKWKPNGDIAASTDSAITVRF